MSADVFLSYSHKDKAQCAAIDQHLTESGFRVWRDTDLVPGERHWDRIEEEIPKCAAFVTLLTENSHDSEAVQRELEIATANNVPPILLVRGLDTKGLGKPWSDVVEHTLTIPFGANFAAGVRKQLKQAIARHAAIQPQVAAVFNMRGGVGKTTLTVEIAERIADRRKKVLLIDMDPQRNLSELYLEMNRYQQALNIYRTVAGLVEPSRLFQENDNTDDWDARLTDPQFNADAYRKVPIQLLDKNDQGLVLDLVPGDLRTIKFTELDAGERLMAVLNFKRAIQSFRSIYDLILFDCNPSASILTKLAIGCTHHLLVPVRPDRTAHRGLLSAHRVLDEFYHLPGPLQTSVFFNHVPRSPTVPERNLMDALMTGDASVVPGADMISEHMLETRIPVSGKLSLKHGHQRDLTRIGNHGIQGRFFDMMPGVGRSLKALTDEIVEKLWPSQGVASHVTQNEVST